MQRSGHTAAQGQIITCCECGSLSVHLCRVSVRFAPRASSINAQSCSNFHSSYPELFMSRHMSTLRLHLLGGCVWTSLPDYINNTGLPAFNHPIYLLVHTSLFNIWLLIVGGPIPFILSDIRTPVHVACSWFKTLVQHTSSRQDHSTRTDNWNPLAGCPRLTLSYSMTRT
jgi:hypothetical protein